MHLAGQNATEEYDPVHPPGTLEEYLKPEAKLGTIDPDTLPKEEAPKEEKHLDNGPPPLDSLLNLDEIEQLGSKQISRKAWAYYYSGGDDLVSKRLNNEAYRSILLRPRVFIDCEQCNTETTIIGCKVGLPIYVSPAAMARLAHPTGEAGIAKACSRFGALQMISNNASMTPEQITSDAQPGQIFAWQLYAQIDRKKSEDMLARINKIPGIKFVVLTLDAPVPGKREDDERSKNVASGLPITSAVQSGSASKPTEGGGGIGKSLFAGTSPKLTWKNTLPWLAQHTKLPLVLKGIQTHEDAYLASLHIPQVKGIILSNRKIHIRRCTTCLHPNIIHNRRRQSLRHRPPRHPHPPRNPQILPLRLPNPRRPSRRRHQARHRRRQSLMSRCERRRHRTCSPLGSRCWRRRRRGADFRK